MSQGSDESLLDLLSESVRAAARTRRFAVGETIVREGEPGSSAFILLSGHCEVTIHGEVLNRVRPGELFGEIACLGGATRTATVRASAESEVLELTGDVIRAELRQSPALLENILRSISNRVRNISTREATVRDEQRRLRRVLEHLQPALDPFRHHPLFSIEVRWQPLSLASGDYYDILELSPTRFLVALGDVMGHGAPTAPIVGMMRSQLHEFAHADRKPHELLHHLHQHMRRHGDTNVFMTLSLVVLDFDNQAAEFSIAGPPCPLLCRAGHARPLTTEFGWTLGYPFEGITFRTENLPLAHGDTLLFFTDGLADAVRGSGSGPDPQGTGQLGAIFAESCAGGVVQVADRVFAGVERYGSPLEDDATALVVTVR